MDSGTGKIANEKVGDVNEILDITDKTIVETERSWANEQEDITSDYKYSRKTYIIL